MKRHILLIDDEQGELNIFMQALNETQLSFKCTYAKDYKHALQMLDYLVPDFVLVDLHIPGMNCMDCLRAIREKHKLQSVTVVVYSEMLTLELVESAYRAGVNYCISKPSDIKDLSNILTDILIYGPESGEMKNPSVKTPG